MNELRIILYQPRTQVLRREKYKNIMAKLPLRARPDLYIVA